MTYDWTELYHKIEITAPSYAIDVQRPTHQTIGEFERESGIALPESYKQFVMLFGPGQLANDVSIRVPNCVSANPVASRCSLNYIMDLATWNRELRSEGQLDENRVISLYKNPQLILRVLFFADNLAGDLFGWDPENPIPNSDGEYPIYVLRREDYEILEHKRSYPAFIFETVLFDEDSFVFYPIGRM